MERWWSVVVRVKLENKNTVFESLIYNSLTPVLNFELCDSVFVSSFIIVLVVEKKTERSRLMTLMPGGS